LHWKKWYDISVAKAMGGMGFRDFQLFNQAMLAKQGWRLLSNPNSLCAKVLKGKYYHDTNFLEARTKRNSSHVWRAILHGREVLKEGLIKRVGDGSTIRAFEDPWIPANFSRKPLARRNETTITMVDELIDDVAGEWIEDKVYGNFITTDARASCSIPLGRNAEDTWAWTYEKSGIFSVR
jgi:hypothetical protein